MIGRIMSAAAVVLLVAGAAEKCEQAPPAKACDTFPQKPAVDRGGKVAFITASTKSTCDKPPISHVVHVSLEEYRNGHWVQAVRGGSPVRNATCREIPPGGGKTVTCTYVYHECRPGRWRTKVLVTGTSHARLDFSFEPPEKPETVIRSCA